MGFTVTDFSAGYGSGQTAAARRIVRHVSFSLPDGTLTALIGNNGCGKSTLLKGLCRLIPSEGSCVLEYTDVPHRDAPTRVSGRLEQEICRVDLQTLSTRQISRLVSYVPQRSGISVSVPVIEVVLMGFYPSLRMFESPGRIHRSRARAALDAVGLADRAEDDYLTLSEGQKQLCILARTLVQDTRLLLLDEPDSALDFSNRRILLNTLRRIVCRESSAPRAGLLVLHDLNLALDCCDQLLLMKDGTVIGGLHPKTDSEEQMSALLSRLYGSVRVFRENGHCFLYQENN